MFKPSTFILLHTALQQVDSVETELPYNLLTWNKAKDFITSSSLALHSKLQLVSLVVFRAVRTVISGQELGQVSGQDSYVLHMALWVSKKLRDVSWKWFRHPECHQNGFCSNTDFFLQMDLELFGNNCSLLKMAESQRVFSFRKFQAQFQIAGGHRQILIYNMSRNKSIFTWDGFSHSVWTTQPSARYKQGWREAVLR